MRFGSLEVGKQADFLVIQPQGKSIFNLKKYALSLGLCCQSSDVDHVYIAGEQVVRDGQVLTVNL